MQTDLRLLLLIVSMVLGAFIVFKAFRDRRLKKPPVIRHHFEKSILENAPQTGAVKSEGALHLGDSDPLLEDYEYKFTPLQSEVTPSAELMDEVIAEPIIEAAPKKAVELSSSPPEIITLALLPSDQKEFPGEELLEVLLHGSYHYGKMKIFHCHKNNHPEQPVLYSIASLVEPGIFDYNAMPYESYRGIIFLMVAQDSSGAAVFEKMLNDAKHLADMLNGTVCDDKRQQLTIQAISNIRMRIRDLKAAEVIS